MYELTFIISPLAGDIDTSATSGKIRSFINGLGGNISKESIGEKKKLAFPIKKQIMGFYATFEFALNDIEKLPELEKMLNLDQDIMRYLLINLDELKPEKTPKKSFGKPKTAIKSTPETGAPVKTERVKIEELDKKLEELLKE